MERVTACLVADVWTGSVNYSCLRFLRTLGAVRRWMVAPGTNQAALLRTAGLPSDFFALTRKRHAHRLTNATGTDVQNDPQNRVQNDFGGEYLQAK
jgi:hypothetical protein